jgi:hypothetical protein
MAQVPVSDHTIGGIIHVQVLRDTTITDPQGAFSAAINAPGISKSLPLNNASSLDFPLHTGALNGTIHVEVDNFTVLPAGATAQTATAISCLIVFKLVEFVHLTIGSVPVTAALK